MAVKTATYEHTPLLVLPFVLEIGAGYPDILVGIAAVAPHVVLHMVRVVFQSGSQVGRQEEQPVETVDVLSPGNPGEVCGPAVCIRVLPRPVIAVPVYVLGRSKDIQSVFRIR